MIENFPKKFTEFIDSSAPPEVRSIYRDLKSFATSDARQKWISQADRCRRAALENEFFNDDEKKEMRKMGQEPHVVNKLVTGIQGASSIATANRPDIKVFPLRESDPYLAELAKVALEHVWLKNFGSDVVYDMVEERNISGTGALYGRLDKNKGPLGAVVFEEEDPTLWYWDENSRKRDRSDTTLIKAQLRSMPYIRDNYPELRAEDIVAINDEFDAQPNKLEDTASGEDHYTREEKGHVPNTDASAKRIVWEIEAYVLKTEQEHWAVVVMGTGETVVIRFQDAKSKKDAEDAMRKVEEEGLMIGNTPSPISSIEYWPRTMNNRYLYIVVGDKIIKQTVDGKETDRVLNPLGVDSDGDPVLPVVFYYGQRTSKAYYRAPTYYAYDANKSLCKRETQYTLAVSKNLSAPVVREDQGTRWKDAERPDRPGNELLISKSSRVPQRLQTAMIDLSALTARIVEDKSNIDEAYGLPEVLRGKVPQGLERMSGRLGLALQDTGTIMQNPAIRGLESTLERAGKMLLSLVLMSWTRDKWEALVTEDRVKDFRPPSDEMNQTPDENKPDELIEQERQERQAKWNHAINKITMEGISVVDFNIAITAGSSLPTNRLLKEETALEKYKVGLYDRQAALEYSGDPHAKEIASRMDQREMQMAQMGAKMKRG